MNSTLSADLFNPKPIEEPVRQNSDEYKVSYKNGKGGIYRSVIRFVPWYVDPNNSIKQKQVGWVVNPITNKGMYVDDPRTVGQRSDIIDMYFKLRNTGRPDCVEYAKNNLSVKTQYAALVQIIEDEQAPDLVNKILVWKFGKTIYDKIYAENHPVRGEGLTPYNPFNGRFFSIICTAQSGFNNLDQSGFFDWRDPNQNLMPTGLRFVNTRTNSWEILSQNSDLELFKSYLVANTPDFGKYDYHPWTAEQDEHVRECLLVAANYLQNGALQVQSTQAIVTNNSPIFPGSVQAVPVQESVPMQQAPGVTPPQMMQQTPPTNYYPQQQAPQMQQQPVHPTPQPMPAAPIMSGPVSNNPIPPGMHPATISSSPMFNVDANRPIVSGVDIPSVEPAVAPPVSTPPQGLGNIDDILSQL